MSHRRNVETEPPTLNSTASVGKSITHDSAEQHVKGSALYIDDIREPAGTLHVAPIYSDATSGRITAVNLDAVKAAKGVIAVLSANDIPGTNDCSAAMGDDPILADDVIQFHGQVVFAVVAETRNQARKAAKLAIIEVAETAAILTARQGHDKEQNILPPYQFKRGNADKSIKAAKHTHLENFTIGGQEHFYLEGQISMAVPKDDDEMLVYVSSQHPSEIQHNVAHMLGLPNAAVTCECRRMGGAFGGKETQSAQWACLAALAAHVTGHPAKMRLDRDDDMMLTGKRHDFECNYQAGFDDLGVLSAVEMTFLSRCGFSCDLSLGVNDRTMFHSDNSYYYDAVTINSHRIKTNTVSNTAFRGFGGPQGMLFAEHMMSSIAAKLKIDPLDIRKANLYRDGHETTPYGMKIEDNIIADVIEELEESSEYRIRRNEIEQFNGKNPYLKKGIALTPVKFGISFTLKHLNQAGALVHVYGDGSVQINHGGTEMGQGLNTKVAQIVADEFGISLDMVKITATTTDKVPNASPTAASAGTDLNGKAAQNAVITIKERLIKLAMQLYQVTENEVAFKDSNVHAASHILSFADLAKQAILERVSLSSTGFYATPKITWDRNTTSGRPFLYFAYGAACAEVTIDTLTGEMKVDRVDILQDVGTSLNPAIDIGQIEGGFVQGMGWLTTEELVYDDKGRLTTHAPSTYKIPTAFDVPEDFRVNLRASEGNKEDTIHKSKAVGEPPIMLANSVFCAIFDAIASLNRDKIPHLNAPATPEEILRAAGEMKS